MAEPGVEPKDLQHLLEAIVTVGSELSLPVVLRRIVETATELVGARYGALGVLDESGTSLSEFLTVGIDDDQVRAIGQLPAGPRHPRPADRRPPADPAAGPLGAPRQLRVPTRAPAHGAASSACPSACGARCSATSTSPRRPGAPSSPRPTRSWPSVWRQPPASPSRTPASTLGSAELRVVEDRERIARDLHDTVIQRLFATGLALQGAAARAGDAEMVDRLQHAVEDLDDTVRHIRTTIFELQRQRIPGRSIRQEILDLVSETVEPAGIQHVVRFDGPIDLAVPDAIADQLVAVVREAVTNVVKHARAHQVEVDLRLTEHHVELRVADDGAGLPDVLREDGNGLRNLRARAERLGGEMVVESGERSGTVLVWRVPVAD